MTSPTWTIDDADELRAAIGDFVRAGRTHDVLPRPRATALGSLDREGPLTIAELANRSQVRHQTMRVTVEALENAGAISVSPSDTDARKVICELTSHGRDLLDRDRNARTSWILEAIESRLSAEQQAIAHQIAGILRRLASAPDRAATGPTN